MLAVILLCFAGGFLVLALTCLFLWSSGSIRFSFHFLLLNLLMCAVCALLAVVLLFKGV